jgi:prepilin-type N-terminal cleavage/methylation domain-containing protein/prepilin-type processing-associated H-X9-DG protein
MKSRNGDGRVLRIPNRSAAGQSADEWARRRCGARTGFTLIELLVVVAIISVLISIVLPGMRQARRQAKQVKCLTHLRAQAEATHFYAADNRGWVIRGIATSKNNPSPAPAQLDYQVYAGPLMKYLRSYDGTKSYTYVYPVSYKAASFMTNSELNEYIARTPQFQCPDHPFPEDVSNEEKKLVKLDYVSSAMPIPYSKKNIDYDAGSLMASPTPEWKEVPVGAVDYVGEYNLERWPGNLSMSQIIWVTEAHSSLALTKKVMFGSLKNDTPRFHHFFLTSMLPFGQRPRIADDRRHPRGITAMFFDGHADVLSNQTADPGWPNSLGLRLKHFSQVPPEYR